MSCNKQTRRICLITLRPPCVRIRTIDHLPLGSSNRTRTTATRKVFRVGELPVLAGRRPSIRAHPQLSLRDPKQSTALQGSGHPLHDVCTLPDVKGPPLLSGPRDDQRGTPFDSKCRSRCRSRVRTMGTGPQAHPLSDSPALAVSLVLVATASGGACDGDRLSVLARASGGSPGALDCQNSMGRPAHRTQPERY
jgi:hypothetical protein